MQPYNILIAGVGGQGNLLLGRIIAEAAVREGFKTIIGETFGASRRGGSVQTHIRIAEKNIGPLVPKDRLDLLIGLEPLEALRAGIRFAGKDTMAIVSLDPVHTLETLVDNSKYPDIQKMISSLARICQKITTFDPKGTLERIGSFRVLNTLVLGMISGMNITPLSQDAIKATIDDIVGFEGKNEKAYLVGIEVAMG